MAFPVQQKFTYGNLHQLITLKSTTRIHHAINRIQIFVINHEQTWRETDK